MEGTDATPEEVAEFREIFNLVDLDGGGSIDLDELRELMDLLGMNASKDEMEAMVNEIDSQGTGEISFRDFVKVMSKKVTPDYTPEQVVSAFKKFANKKTPNGYITKEDLVHVLSSYEGKMPEERTSHYHASPNRLTHETKPDECIGVYAHNSGSD